MNPIQYFTTTAFTEFVHDPFVGVAVVFAVVATIFLVACGNNIGRDSAWTILAADRNEMIHSEHVEQAGRTATIGATTMKIIKGELPISILVIVGQACLSSHIPLKNNSKFLSIIFFVLALSPANLVLILESVCLPFGAAAWIITLADSIFLALCIQVAGAPFAASLAAFLSVFFSPFLAVRAQLILVACIFTLLVGAWLASRTKYGRVIAIVCIEVFKRGREFLSADRARLNRRVALGHTFFAGITQMLASRTYTRLAAQNQSVWFGLVFVKVFGSSRKLLIALSTTLKGCGIMGLHKKFTFLLPSPRLFAQRWDISFPPVIIPQTGGKV